MSEYKLFYLSVIPEVLNRESRGVYLVLDPRVKPACLQAGPRMTNLKMTYNLNRQGVSP